MDTSSIMVATPLKPFLRWIPGHRKLVRDISLDINLTTFGSDAEGDVCWRDGTSPSYPLITSCDREGKYTINGKDLTIETDEFRLEFSISDLPPEGKIKAFFSTPEKEGRRKVSVVHYLESE